MRKWASAIGAAIMIAVLSMSGTAQAADDATYSQNEILAKAEGFFGSTTKGLAEGIGKVFKDQGRPVGFITGEEFGGAFVVGLRYGRGKLNRKVGTPQQFYWQ